MSIFEKMEGFQVRLIVRKIQYLEPVIFNTSSMFDLLCLVNSCWPPLSPSMRKDLHGLHIWSLKRYICMFSLAVITRIHVVRFFLYRKTLQHNKKCQRCVSVRLCFQVVISSIHNSYMPTYLCVLLDDAKELAAWTALWNLGTFEIY